MWPFIDPHLNVVQAYPNEDRDCNIAEGLPMASNTPASDLMTGHWGSSWRGLSPIYCPVELPQNVLKNHNHLHLCKIQMQPLSILPLMILVLPGLHCHKCCLDVNGSHYHLAPGILTHQSTFHPRLWWDVERGPGETQCGHGQTHYWKIGSTK